MWMGLAALCAGIIHLALVVSSPPAAAVVLLLIGLAEIAWAIFTVMRSRVSKPRVVLTGAAVPTLLWGILVGVAAISHTPAIASYLGFSAMFCATIFELFVAVTIAVLIRRRTDFGAATREPSAPRLLAGVLVGAILSALLVTPALAATDAGKYATPMGDMPGMSLGTTSLTIRTP
jgi:hypothetical protein